MDQDGTWHVGRHQPRRLCGVRWGPSPLPKKGTEPPPQFSAHFHCDQTAGCTKVPLGMEVGLSPGTLCSMGIQSLPKKGARSPVFGLFLLWLNGWMAQDGTWHVDGLGPGHIVLDWGPAPLPKKGAEPPIFGPFLMSPNGWMHQDATWCGGRPQLGDFVLDGDPAPLPKRRWSPGAEPPILGPCLLWPNGWMHQDATWYGGRPQPRRLCV